MVYNLINQKIKMESNAPEQKENVEQEEVELTQNKWIANVASPFLNKSKDWDDKEAFGIPEDIAKNIVDELGFKFPSKIQSATIPMISDPKRQSIIAQGKNGVGKTGAFTIGSVLQIDRENPNTQIIAIAHVRELVNQIASVYEKIVKGTGITVSNYSDPVKTPGQIIVVSHGKLE